MKQKVMDNSNHNGASKSSKGNLTPYMGANDISKNLTSDPLSSGMLNNENVLDLASTSGNLVSPEFYDTDFLGSSFDSTEGKISNLQLQGNKKCSIITEINDKTPLPSMYTLSNISTESRSSIIATFTNAETDEFGENDVPENIVKDEDDSSRHGLMEIADSEFLSYDADTVQVVKSQGSPILKRVLLNLPDNLKQKNLTDIDVNLDPGFDYKEVKKSKDEFDDLLEDIEEGEGESETDKKSRKSLPHKKRISNKLKQAAINSTKNTKGKTHKCLKCGDLFATQFLLNLHKQQEHIQTKQPFTCEICGKGCSNQHKFFEHLKVHYDQSDIFEPIDQDCFDLKRSEHENKVLPCEKCGRVFRRQRAYDCHMSISHPKEEEIEQFSDPEDMMEGIRHMVDIVPDDVWQQGENSDEETLQEDNEEVPDLKGTIKMESIDESNKKRRKETALKCKFCDRVFAHRNSLLYHIKSHSGNRSHVCKTCGKGFFAAGALKIHERLHSGEKPYKCEFCDRYFRQWGDLKYHKTSIHSGIKSFQCEFCGKDFARKYSLVVHRRIHTGEKNYVCEYCTKSFRAASYLQNHRRIHTGEKPHSCGICGKPFRVRSDMKRHLKTHGNIGHIGNSVKKSDKVEVKGGMMIKSPKLENCDEEEKLETNADDIDDSSLDVSLDSINVTQVGQTSEETYEYETRDSLERDGSETLFVWIQTDAEEIITGE